MRVLYLMALIILMSSCQQLPQQDPKRTIAYALKSMDTVRCDDHVIVKQGNVTIEVSFATNMYVNFFTVDGHEFMAYSSEIVHLPSCKLCKQNTNLNEQTNGN